jgi:hypothetical protein
MNVEAWTKHLAQTQQGPPNHRGSVAHAGALAALLLIALIGYQVIPRAGGSSTATFADATPGVFWVPISAQGDVSNGYSSQVGTRDSLSPCVVPIPNAPDGQTNYTDSPGFGEHPTTFHRVSLRLVRHVTVGLRRNMLSFGGNAPGPPHGRLAIRYAAFATIYQSSPLPGFYTGGDVRARWIGKSHPKHFVVTLRETVQLNAFGTDVSMPAVAGYISQDLRWHSGQTPEAGFTSDTDCPDFTATGPVVGLRVTVGPAVQTSAGTVGIVPQSAERVIHVNR